jgi:hypothetical protein
VTPAPGPKQHFRAFKVFKVFKVSSVRKVPMDLKALQVQVLKELPVLKEPMEYKVRQVVKELLAAKERQVVKA